MSKRSIRLEPTKVRAMEYDRIPREEVLEAIWEALDCLRGQGIDVGPKATAMLDIRNTIKEKLPKDA